MNADPNVYKQVDPTDKREVRMYDIIKALRANDVHAADCPRLKAVFFVRISEPCNCWVNPDQLLSLVVNG